MTPSKVHIYRLCGLTEENAVFTFLDGSDLLLVPSRFDGYIRSLESALLYDRNGKLNAAVVRDSRAPEGEARFWRDTKSPQLPLNAKYCQKRLAEYLEDAARCGREALSYFALRVCNSAIWHSLPSEDRYHQCLSKWEIWRITAAGQALIESLKRGSLEAYERLPERLSGMALIPTGRI